MLISKKQLISLISIAIFALMQLAMISAWAQPALADEALFNSQEGISEIGQVYGNNKTDIRVIIGKIILVALGFLAAIFVALTIYAGFRYMTAAGNQDQTKKAVAQIRDAVIGLIIVLAAWAITTFVLNAMNWTTGGSPNAWY